MNIITENHKLQNFCTNLGESDYITVDTEFLRDKTYWPKLCVLQIGGADNAAAIDMLTPNLDLTPITKLFDDKSVTKVFHAARQDLEIFFNLIGRLPEPIFDTQIAAMVCGFGDSISYEHLVAQFSNKKIDKSSRFTDWSVRPLSKKQIEYAISDVTHLRIVYDHLKYKLIETGREHWITEEMEILTDPETYMLAPSKAYKRIKIKTSSKRFMAILKEVAGWREIMAQKQDVPRGRIIKDETLIEIAHHTPKTSEQLSKIRGLGKHLAAGKASQMLLEAIYAGKTMPDLMCPSIPAKTELPKGIGPIVDLLKVLLKLKSEEFKVAGKLLANSNEINQIAAFGEHADVRALNGWRREIFGDDALSLKTGKSYLTVEKNKLRLVTRSNNSKK